MQSEQVAGLIIEGPYDDGDYALHVGKEIAFLTPRQMLTLAENLIDRIPQKIMEGGGTFEFE